MNLIKQHIKPNKSLSNLFSLLATIVSSIILIPYSLYHLVVGNHHLSLMALASILLFITSYLFIVKIKIRHDFIVWPIPLGIVILATFALYEIGIAASYWIFPATLSLYLILKYRAALIFSALLFILSVIVLIINNIGLDIIVRFSSAIVILNIFFGTFVYAIEYQRELLNLLAIKDPLTGLLNRSTLYELLNNAQHRHNRNGTPSSILSLDLDHFKNINDQFGHQAGDQTLVNLATLFKSSLRGNDSIFRVGGEEFLILLDNTNIKEAENIAEQIRVSIEDSHLVLTTSSLGCSQSVLNGEVEDWIKLSDKALYKAKRDGRNQVRISK